MKRFITMFLLMNCYTTSWGMENPNAEYRYDEVEDHYICGRPEKVTIVVSYAIEQTGRKNRFKVYSKKSYPDGSISNRSFEWEEPGSEGFPDAHKQWHAMSCKLSSITRVDDKKILKAVMDNIVFHKMRSY